MPNIFRIYHQFLDGPFDYKEEIKKQKTMREYDKTLFNI